MEPVNQLSRGSSGPMRQEQRRDQVQFNKVASHPLSRDGEQCGV